MESSERMESSGLETMLFVDDKALGDLGNMMYKFSFRLTVERGKEYGVEMDWRGFRVYLKEVTLSEMEDAIISIYSFFAGLEGKFFTKEKYGFLRWEENSCFFDSLLFSLFVSKAGRNICREIEKSEPRFYRSMCEFRFDSISDFEPVFQRAKSLFVETIDKFLMGHSMTCQSIRKALTECIPSLKEDGYVAYNIYELYSHMADIFSLGEAHTFSSFLTDKTWRDGDRPYLVFYNTGAPRIRNMGKTGEERVSWKERESTTYKIRAFGKEILNYSLSAVIFLTGVTSEGGGNHYFCYAKDGFGDVYFFDDTGGDTKGKRIVDDFPSDTFEEGHNFPAMYLYHSNHRI